MVELSAKVRTGVLTREEALEALKTPPYFETDEMVDYCLKKQGMPREEYDALLKAPNKYFTDYPSWYPLLRLFRWPVKLMCRRHMLPAHVYEKFFEAV